MNELTKNIKENDSLINEAFSPTFPNWLKSFLSKKEVDGVRVAYSDALVEQIRRTDLNKVEFVEEFIPKNKATGDIVPIYLFREYITLDDNDALESSRGNVVALSPIAPYISHERRLASVNVTHSNQWDSKDVTIRNATNAFIKKFAIHYGYFTNFQTAQKDMYDVKADRNEIKSKSNRRNPIAGRMQYKTDYWDDYEFDADNFKFVNHSDIDKSGYSVSKHVNELRNNLYIYIAKDSQNKMDSLLKDFQKNTEKLFSIIQKSNIKNRDVTNKVYNLVYDYNHIISSIGSFSDDLNYIDFDTAEKWELENVGRKLKELIKTIEKFGTQLDRISIEEMDENLIVEAKQDIENFIDKFGQETYDIFNANKDKLASKLKISKDITWHVKNTSVEEMNQFLSKLDMLAVAKDRGYVFDNEGNLIDNSKLIVENQYYKVCEIPDYQTAINLSYGGSWCIAGRYDIPKDAPAKASQASQYFNQYLRTSYTGYAFAIPKDDTHTPYAFCSMSNGIFDIWNADDYRVSKSQVSDEVPDFEFNGCKFAAPVTAIINGLKVVDGNVVGVDEGVTSFVLDDDFYNGEYKFVDNLPAITKIIVDRDETSILSMDRFPNLKEIEYTNNVQTIDRVGLSRSVNKITIPNSVTCIKRDAFHRMPNLKKIYIPSSVRKFGANFLPAEIKYIATKDVVVQNYLRQAYPQAHVGYGGKNMTEND